MIYFASFLAPPVSEHVDSTMEIKFGLNYFKFFFFAIGYVFKHLHKIKCVKYRIKMFVWENNFFILKLFFNNLIFQDNAYFYLHDLDE